jgi:hypothetical protein
MRLLSLRKVPDRGEDEASVPCAARTFTRRVDLDSETALREVRPMLNSYDLFLLQAAEERVDRLYAEAEQDRLASTVRPVRSHRRPGLLQRFRGRWRERSGYPGRTPARP